MKIRRLATVGALVACVVAVLAVPAAAHVTVDPKTAVKGSYAKITFRVPNERDVPTTKIAVKFNLDHPIASVSVKPTPGWTYEVTKAPLPKPIESGHGTITEGVSVITWSGGEIKPGEFQEFSVSGGPLPTDVDALQFPAVQTYADGEEVAWIDPPAAEGQPRPEHPAPLLKLTDANAAPAGDASSSGSTDSAPAVTAAPETGAEASDSDSGNGLAVAALVVGGIALVLGAASLVMGRSRA